MSDIKKPAFNQIFERPRAMTDHDRGDHRFCDVMDCNAALHNRATIVLGPDWSAERG